MKNPERLSGFNGSEIWYELYTNNLGLMKFPTKGLHENFLFKIISGFHVGITMHISRFYMDDLEHAQDVHIDDFGPKYDIYYERIGRHPDRIKNLFYTYTFMLHTIDEIKLNLPKYIYDNASDYENEKMRNNMKWLGHYVTGLVDLDMIDSDLLSNISRKDFINTIKPTFENITILMDCVG
jgi:ERO1-like protein alpha